LSTLLPTLITWFHLYGYPVLWVCIFLSSLGLPLPSIFALLAAGAFAALGDFNVVLLGAVALSAAVAGDSVGYLVGRLIGSKLITWLEQQKHFNIISPRTIARSQTYFRAHGGLAILLSRFLVPVLGGPINLLAGAEIYPYRRFFIYDVSGQAICTVILLALGYVFAASWEAVGNVIVTVSLLILALLIVLYLALRLVRMLRGMHASQSQPDVAPGAEEGLIPEEGVKDVR